MRHYGLLEKYVRIFQAFFNGAMSAVRVNGEMSDWFSVNSGTEQGVRVISRALLYLIFV